MNHSPPALHRHPSDEPVSLVVRNGSRRTVLGWMAGSLAMNALAVTGLAGLTSLAPGSVQAQAGSTAAVPVEVATDLPGARLQGSGRLTFFGLQVYQARLWVTEGFSTEAALLQPIALELEYARNLVGRLIAERSLEEMREVGEVPDAQAEAWLAGMTAAFPDVKKGDRITGVHRPGMSARFHVNGRLTAEVRDAGFARSFFAIWLSPRTSEPGLRQSLLADKA